MGRYWTSLRILWLLVSFICLIAPVFLPTSRYPADFLDDPMGTATGIMFVLSFPLSLFAVPIIFFMEFSLGIRSYSIQGAYLNLLILFAFGLVQWFWIVPRLLQKKNKSGLQILDLHAHKPSAALGEAHISTDFPFFDSKSRTPVERVIDDYRER